MINKSKSENEIIKRKKLIIILSIIIPLIVLFLFSIKIKGVDLSFLPSIYATINALTSLMLVIALIAVKNKKYILHEKIIKFCFVLSVLFLLMYVSYHITSESTKFGGEGFIKILYYLILFTHILLSVFVVPLVLFTYFFAWKGEFNKHKKWARITWPIWFYVCTSGVIVYIMISPYYIN